MHDLCAGHHLRHRMRWLIVTRDRLKSSMDSSEITLEAVSSVSQIAAEDWDACANPACLTESLEGLDTLASPGATTGSYNPFVSHAFFSALEASGSTCATRTSRKSC
jgi:predicted N-acyltransferase